MSGGAVACAKDGGAELAVSAWLTAMTEMLGPWDPMCSTLRKRRWRWRTYTNNKIWNRPIPISAKETQGWDGIKKSRGDAVC